MDLTTRFAYDSFRPGQEEFARRVYEGCMSRQILIAEAMSGFGKTAAVLVGAVAASEETGSRVVYACRTKRQILRVIEEVSRMQRKHRVEAASLLTKFDYCLLMRQGRPVSPETFGLYCKFNVQNNLCSYFLNVTLSPGEFEQAVNRALRAVPSHLELMRDSESIHVCPYEVAKMAVTQARVAVVPYHYVFDERIAPTLFDRNSLERSKTILVVDEAHNLRDFLRGVGSASLSLDQVDGAIREADALFMEEAARSLKALRIILQRTVSSSPGWLLDRELLLEQVRSEQGTAWLQNLAFELTACSEAAWGSFQYRGLPSFIPKTGEFLSRLSSAESEVLVNLDGGLGLLEPNPVASLGQHLQRFRSSVLVSATVNPSEVFRRSLGLDKVEVSIYATPSDPSVTVRTVIDTGVTTRYKARTPQMFCKIADKIAGIISSTQNGIGVFASSYSVLQPIYEMVSKRADGRNMVKETRGFTSQEAAEAFDSFRSDRGSVLFAVQGGRFSEGEDFREDMMDAVVIVGLSLPPPTATLYAEYECLKRAGEKDSFLILSRLPALRKAFQAAGRHIRNPGKKGMVFMLDQRFDSSAVRELMPAWLRTDIVSGDFNPPRLAEISAEFWSRPD
ncbi:MAG: ATP-dependent DNA helicase [Thaumarchaeota archaeon]|nr:ATP-dependent DNA helicase [Nitrososphaerota archaeon]